MRKISRKDLQDFSILQIIIDDDETEIKQLQKESERYLPATRERMLKRVKSLKAHEKKMKARQKKIAAWIDGISNSELREVVRMKYIQDKSWKEIEQTLSGGTCKPRHYERMLRKYMEEQNGRAADQRRHGQSVTDSGQ